MQVLYIFTEIAKTGGVVSSNNRSTTDFLLEFFRLFSPSILCTCFHCVSLVVRSFYKLLPFLDVGDQFWHRSLEQVHFKVDQLAHSKVLFNSLFLKTQPYKLQSNFPSPQNTSNTLPCMNMQGTDAKKHTDSC